MRTTHASGQPIAWSLLAMLFTSSPALSAGDWPKSYHEDGRGTVKQLFFPASPQALDSDDPISIAWTYLRTQASDFGLSPDLYGLQLSSQKESLLGTHLHFTQAQSGIPIEGAEIVISIMKADKRIYQVYNNLLPRRFTLNKISGQIKQDQAFDIAWNFLGVRGELFENPRASLVAISESGAQRAAWRIELSTTEPYGTWKLYIDAETGKIIRFEDQRISHRPIQKTFLQKSQGALSNRLHAFHTWQLKNAQVSRLATKVLKPGTAQVFDPDPRTTLLDRNLQDSSSADRFIAAYFNRMLPEISFDGNQYQLEGPWVKIVDWDPPTNAPSKTLDGKWSSLRGDNSFNDAMSYYHLDKNQRYMQALGYTGSRGIQAVPIEVDTDGVNGDDNSYFQPGSNRLSFGHGCVDDNEDTDVILHEYGHAINYSINPNWGGGDMGAMGEGFGDYWAASYSLSTENGEKFFKNEIYTWDGHGNGSTCWAGRILNALEARYDHNQNYAAHGTIEGGFQSDELWSTPLFQARLRLLSLGIAREEVDSIVLESQFGLGANVKMRDMAQAIVVVAEQLYNGPHAQVFRESFLRQGILEEPHSVLSLSLGTVKDSRGDGSIDPNEDVSLKLRLNNSGNLTATGILMMISSQTPGVSIIQGSSSFADIDPSQSALSLDLLQVHIDSQVPCGTLVKLSAMVKYNEGLSQSFPFELRIGQAIGLSVQSSPKLPIPDADPKGVIDTLNVQSSALVSKQFQVGLEIRHPYRGDLQVKLIAPSGKQLLLQDRSGVSEDDIVGIYPSTLTPKEDMSKLLGEPLQGPWRLQAIDTANSDQGVLQSWSLSDIAGFQCR
ncbi:MAG: proprotein convertase P-domain-containing protein [Proteobacteria bacterium]|nr:proprotein convertase P-domain-containing protein [Pseudomonadota bacterium]